MSPAVLRSKVNPNCQTHHLSLREADEIMRVTDDLQMLHALAGGHDCVVQPIAAGQPDSLFGAHLASSSATGDLAGVLAAALADGRVSQREASAIAHAGAVVQAAIVHLVQQTWTEAQRVSVQPPPL